MAAALVVLAVTVSGFYVWMTLRKDLQGAVELLERDASSLVGEDLERTASDLLSAHEGLTALPARFLEVFPILRQNVFAARQAVASAADVLTAGAELVDKRDALERAGLIEKGHVRLDLITALDTPLTASLAAVQEAQAELEPQLSGWLLPPVWNSLNGLLDRLDGLERAAAGGRQLIELLPGLLGEDRPRAYLIVFINNAELRGAGGIPSAAGTLSARAGKVRLGRLYHTFNLRGERPYETVPAPADFQRRFAQYGADSTLWVNTTFSPDVPDVALVAARLFEVATEVDTDGVIFVDPRGIATLLPADATVKVEKTGAVLTRDQIPQYIYSDAYAELGGQGRRREILLEIGRQAFESAIERGLGGRETLAHTAAAIAGGHIRFVSFKEEEQAVFDALGVSGDLAPPTGDGLLVTAQNLGGDKLDYWVERSIRHQCLVAEGVTRCSTTVAIDNTAPTGLSRYVANKPYGLLESLVEVYVPARAEIVDVELDDQATEFILEEQDGYQSVGVSLMVPRDESTEIDVDYELDLEGDAYELTVTPQPLARDAHIIVDIRAPGTWNFRGPGELQNGIWHHDGVFDRRIEISARDEWTGISDLWARLLRFWSGRVL